MENKSRKIIVYADGGARGNPGPAACAFVVEEEGRVVYKSGFFLGITTNNVAEYRGVIEAYKWLLKKRKDLKQVVFKMDSELVSKQLEGVYKVRNKSLFRLWSEVKRMEKEFKDKVSYVRVPRPENKEADRLLNLVLDRVSRHISRPVT